jgi:hypothetical protein
MSAKRSPFRIRAALIVRLHVPSADSSPVRPACWLLVQGVSHMHVFRQNLQQKPSHHCIVVLLLPVKAKRRASHAPVVGKKATRTSHSFTRCSPHSLHLIHLNSDSRPQHMHMCPSSCRHPQPRPSHGDSLHQYCHRRTGNVSILS